MQEIVRAIGDKERALADVAYAIETRDHRVTQLKVNPVYDPLALRPTISETAAAHGASALNI